MILDFASGTSQIALTESAGVNYTLIEDERL